jgi:predicted AlkP superfamily pyrophosphatase or phosphodiesterase
MKTHLLLAAILGLADMAVCHTPASRTDRSRGKDHHVIMISLDGFPASKLRDTTLPLPILRRLIREGAVSDGLKPVNPSVTWPNHTSMITGVYPARHGIIHNGLLVRPDEGKPLHITPLVTEETLQATSVSDLAHNAGLTTADVDWLPIYQSTVDWSFREKPQLIAGWPSLGVLFGVWVTCCSAIMWLYCVLRARPRRKRKILAAALLPIVLPIVLLPLSSLRGRTMHNDFSNLSLYDLHDKVEREMLTRGLVNEDEIRSWSTDQKLRDDVLTRAAVHIIEQHRPNLLLLHLQLTDSVQHQYGMGPLASNAFMLADRQIQRVLDAIDRAGIRNKTTILIVSDHGFKAYRRTIRPNVILRDNGLVRQNYGGLDCDAWTIAKGGTAMVYVTREDRREQTLKVLERAFEGVPGITKVIRSSEYQQYGYPKLEKQGHMSDLVLAAESGYAFDGSTNGGVITDVAADLTPATHGYMNSDPDMNGILVAWGVGIQPGAHVGMVANVDVAPTVARFLDLELPRIDGTVLENILRK